MLSPKGRTQSQSDFTALQCEPVKVLPEDAPDIPTGTVYIFCPCQLHLNLGIVVHFVEAVERLDPEFAAGGRMSSASHATKSTAAHVRHGVLLKLAFLN